MYTSANSPYHCKLFKQIIASLSAYCVRACKIKHFTEREFSGIFSLAGGEFCFFKTGIPGGPDGRARDWFGRAAYILRACGSLVFRKRNSLLSLVTLFTLGGRGCRAKVQKVLVKRYILNIKEV